ncbi:hypothetical protein N7465_008310 [Penicillium sp. CMV-2018d]|nr:hypothetical protein N7465_008310 [Penicillium sp. CMV-2018d]
MGDDTASEVTLLPKNQSKGLESKRDGSKKAGNFMPRSSMGFNADTLTEQSDGQMQRGGTKGKLSRLKKQLTG